MFSVETLIMVCTIVFCIGGLIGAVISRTLIPPAEQKSLENQLNKAQTDLEAYQQDVAQHFAETSQLINTLTESYREVHDHLAKGAVQLTNPEISQKIISAGDSSLGIEANKATENIDVEPPKDWAPKTPGQKGVLSEDFGLDEDQSDITEQVKK